MSDEKEVVNADEYAAMRKELVVMRKVITQLTDAYCPCDACKVASRALKECPIAAELSKQEGGNG
jgi:hypothetical protein